MMLLSVHTGGIVVRCFLWFILGMFLVDCKGFYGGISIVSTAGASMSVSKFFTCVTRKVWYASLG